jgi:hypothetical protein
MKLSRKHWPDQNKSEEKRPLQQRQGALSEGKMKLPKNHSRPAAQCLAPGIPETLCPGQSKID